VSVTAVRRPRRRRTHPNFGKIKRVVHGYNILHVHASIALKYNNMYRERHPYRCGQVIRRIYACPSGVGTYLHHMPCRYYIVCAADFSVHKVGVGGGGLFKTIIIFRHIFYCVLCIIYYYLLLWWYYHSRQTHGSSVWSDHSSIRWRTRFRHVTASRRPSVITASDDYFSNNI